MLMKQLSPTKVVGVVNRDPDHDPEAGIVEFRLTYEGPLFAADRKGSGGADHKHEIRRAIHLQLRRLWETYRPLKTAMTSQGFGTHKPLATALAEQFIRDKYRFVPLVYDAAQVLCGIDVLLLRPGDPGGVVLGGDLDNRLKTLLDALRMPRQTSELGKYSTPGDGEDPFFVLLEDDRMVSNFRVEADTLLDTKLEPREMENEVHLIITVRIKPYGATWGNLHYL